MSLLNATAYVRRRMGGMSLATQELLAPWDLPSRQVVTFSLTCVAYERVLSGSLYKFANAENLEVASWWESVKIRVREIFKQGIRSMSTVHYAVLYRFKLEEELVNNWKTTRRDMSGGSWIPSLANRIKMTTPTTGQGCVSRPTQGSGWIFQTRKTCRTAMCVRCVALHGRLGAQEIKCEEKPESYHTFTLTESQLARLKNDLRESDQDPPGIRNAHSIMCRGVPFRGR